MTYAPLISVSVVREGRVPSPSTICDKPEIVAAIVREMIGSDEREHFIAFYLDACHRIKGIQEVSIGTMTCSLVHPREVFRPGIILGATGIVVAHNHPSGDLRPSPDDRETTRRLMKAGGILGIPILDHVIVGISQVEGGQDFISFRERGLMTE